MHKYLHHIGDFMRDTSHLSPVEECFYRRAIDWYYLNEKPFPNDMREVCRLLRAKGKIQVQAVETVFGDFFFEDGNLLKNSRCEKEISAYKSKNNANRENGKTGGRPKKNNDLKNHGGSSSVNDGLSEETHQKGNHKPLTNNPNIDSSSNAHEGNFPLPAIQFSQYHTEDTKRYTILECVNQYPLQNDFIELGLQRFSETPTQDLIAMFTSFGDFFSSKGVDAKNTPSLWLVKWLSWIQNNKDEVRRQREPKSTPKKQNQFSNSASRTSAEVNEWMSELSNDDAPTMRDVHEVEGVKYA